MLGRVAHLWANIKPAWILQKRITHEETLSAQFWWMSQPLLFYSMVANITDTVSWKEFVLPLRCEMHIDYGAPWVSCPWQGWYWLEPALAVNYCRLCQFVYSWIIFTTNYIKMFIGQNPYSWPSGKDKIIHHECVRWKTSPLRLHPGWSVLALVHFC